MKGKGRDRVRRDEAEEHCAIGGREKGEEGEEEEKEMGREEGREETT